jgi:hypothetical protein
MAEQMTVHSHPRTVRVQAAHFMSRDEFRTIDNCLDRLANMLGEVGLDADKETVESAAKLMDSMRRLLDHNFFTIIRATRAEEEAEDATVGG